MRSWVAFFLLVSSSWSATLEQLIQYTLENNSDLARLEQMIQAGSADEASAGMPDNPRLSTGLNDILASDPYARDREPMQTQYFQLSQSIPLSGRLKLAETVAKEKTQLARLAKEEAEVRLAYEIKTTVYGIVKLQNDLLIIERFGKVLDDLVQVHTLYNIESRTHYEMTLKSSILSQEIERRRVRTQNRIKSLEGMLVNLLNGPFDSIQYSLSLLPLPALETIRGNLDNNPSVALARQEQKIAQKESELAKRESVPDLSVGIGYFQREAFDDYYALNLTLPLPVYGKEEAKELKTMRIAQAKKEAETTLENRIESEMERAYYSMKSASEEYLILEKIVASQKEMLDVLSKKIESKQSSLQEGYETIKAVLESEFSLNEMLYQFNLYYAYAKMLEGER